MRRAVIRHDLFFFLLCHCVSLRMIIMNVSKVNKNADKTIGIRVSVKLRLSFAISTQTR